MVSPYKTGWDTYKRCGYYKRREIEGGVGYRCWEMQYRLE